MKVLIWNVSGLGQSSRKSVVRAFTSKLSPTILALLKTKLLAPNHQLIRRVWGSRPYHWISLPADGASGGIWVVWHPFDLSLINHFIGSFSVTLLLSNISDGVQWKFSAVYGPNSCFLMQRFWLELDHISSLPHLVWCVGGDFNVTRWSYERNTSTSISPEMRDFSDFISRNDLLDIPLQSCQYTWSSHSPNPTLCKLDRFLISMEWEEKFSRTLSQALPKPASDHCPILLDTKAINRRLPSVLNFTSCKRLISTLSSKPGELIGISGIW
ncbi:hypothetical protein AMTRI_Chr01g115140 [Amborella trichopoda]